MALSSFWRHLRGELRDPRGWREPNDFDRADRSEVHEDRSYERDRRTSAFDDRWGNAYALGVPSTGLDYTGRSADPGEYVSADQDDARWWNDRAGWPEQRVGGFRGKGPRGYRRSDERIREDVNECLTDDHHIDASDIEVEVRDAEVTLSGIVSSREQKRRAEELIERLSGVADVHNRLRVSSGNSETPQPSV